LGEVGVDVRVVVVADVGLISYTTMIAVITMMLLGDVVVIVVYLGEALSNLDGKAETKTYLEFLQYIHIYILFFSYILLFFILRNHICKVQGRGEKLYLVSSSTRSTFRDLEC
jgi:hypothetical protein